MAVGGGVRLGRVTIICLVLGVAGLFGWVGPRLLGDAAARGRTLATAKKKLDALHDFALFRSRGDKAVLRWGEAPRARSHTTQETDTTTPHRQRHGAPASEN